MLKICKSLSDLDFDKLCHIYEYDDYTSCNDLYDYLSEDFFRVAGSFYAVWDLGSEYVSALRMEPYDDGYLLQALQTAKEHRRNGYAKKLLDAVLDSLIVEQNMPVYTHIYKNNHASIALHRGCGFDVHLDYADFVDGTVSANAVTLKFTGKKSHI